MTLADIRDNGLHPVLYADQIPAGVLHSVGPALWEMPATATGGGYLHGLHVWDSAAATTYSAKLKPGVEPLPSIASAAKITQLAAEIVASSYARLDVSELDTTYARGGSICLQNCIFAPTYDPNDPSPPLNYDYSTDLNQVLANWSGPAPWITCGMAGHSEFFTGEPGFNELYPIRSRTARNTFRDLFLSDQAKNQIPPDAYTVANELILSTGNVITGGHLWPHCAFDPTHPDVVDMCLDHVEGIVGEFGPQLRYGIGGENLISLRDASLFGGDGTGCGTVPFDSENCSRCAPVTNYAPHLIQGFRTWLTTVLGLDLAGINERWGTTFPSLTAIDPITTPFCPNAPGAQEDWAEFVGFVLHETQVAQAMRAKQTDPTALVGLFRFGLRGIEQAALQSDMAMVGDWFGATEAVYLAEKLLKFEAINSANRLSGVPGGFMISSPPHNFVAVPTGQDAWPPIMRAYFQYRRWAVRWWVREVWTCGAAHLGYLKSQYVGFGAHAPSVEAVLGGLEEVQAIHATHLAMCGPHQRVVLHSHGLDEFYRPGYENAPAGQAMRLHFRLREQGRPCAVISSDRWLDRGLSRAEIAKSLVILPFHPDHDELRQAYEPLFPDGADGALLVIVEDPAAVSDPGGSAPDWVDETVLVQTSRGTLFRGKDSSEDPINVFYFAALPERECLDFDANRDRYALVLERDVLPVIEEHMATSTAAPVTVTPTDAGTPLRDVVHSFVTDGLNFAVAISNLHTIAQEVDVAVDDAIATALGVTYTTQSIMLGAVQSETDTQYLLLEADVTGIDVAAAITTASANLDELELQGSFDVTHGRALLAQATALLAEHPGRAAAAVVAATRMVYLEASYASGTANVAAYRIGLAGEDQTIAVAGARVQVLWSLNGREEGATGTTSGTGNCSLPVGAPAAQHWDWHAHALAAPGAEANDLIELTVTASDGATSRTWLITT